MEFLHIKRNSDWLNFTQIFRLFLKFDISMISAGIASELLDSYDWLKQFTSLSENRADCQGHYVNIFYHFKLPFIFYQELFIYLKVTFFFYFKGDMDERVGEIDPEMTRDTLVKKSYYNEVSIKFPSISGLSKGSITREISHFQSRVFPLREKNPNKSPQVVHVVFDKAQTPVDMDISPVGEELFLGLRYSKPSANLISLNNSRNNSVHNEDFGSKSTPSESQLGTRSTEQKSEDEVTSEIDGKNGIEYSPFNGKNDMEKQERNLGEFREEQDTGSGDDETTSMINSKEFKRKNSKSFRHCEKGVRQLTDCKEEKVSESMDMKSDESQWDHNVENKVKRKRIEKLMKTSNEWEKNGIGFDRWENRDIDFDMWMNEKSQFCDTNFKSLDSRPASFSKSQQEEKLRK